jgi:hypothetical protein
MEDLDIDIEKHRFFHVSEFTQCGGEIKPTGETDVVAGADAETYKCNRCGLVGVLRVQPIDLEGTDILLVELMEMTT